MHDTEPGAQNTGNQNTDQSAGTDAPASPDTPPRRTRSRAKRATTAETAPAAAETGKKAAPTRKSAAKKAAAATTAATTKPPAKRAAKKTAAAGDASSTGDASSRGDDATDSTPPTDEPVAKTPRKTATKRAAKKSVAEAVDAPARDASEPDDTATAPGTAAKKTTRKRTTKKAAGGDPASDTRGAAVPAAETPTADTAAPATAGGLFVAPGAEAAPASRQRTRRGSTAAPLFQAPDPSAPVAPGPTPDASVPAQDTDATSGDATNKPSRRSRSRTQRSTTTDTQQDAPQRGGADAPGEQAAPTAEDTTGTTGPSDESETDGGSTRRRRRRGGRGRRRKPSGEDGDSGTEGADGAATGEPSPAATTDTDQASDVAAGTGLDETGPSEPTEGTSKSSRRRRSRRRSGDSTDAPAPDDPPQTVVRVREARPSTDDDVTSLKGSTRLEAKKQRRRDGRDQGRRRTPIISESEFLARRESVERVMVVRQAGTRTQIAVLEDGVLVEHYVAQASQTSSVGNVYLGKVQNVLPAMEAAFIDIGKGRNAVLYAGEVAWSRMGLDGKARRMESVLSSGQSVLVQVTKDPVGHKGARLTGLVSLPGRFLVYAPGGSMSGISRKLPEKERARLKAIVKKVFPDEASVIIRTAAEGTSEDEMSNDIHRLEAQWLDIEAKAKTATSPATLYAEPDLAIKVVRDMFNEDFARLVISGDEAWETLHTYVSQVAPDLVDRLTHWTSEKDVFAEHRVDDQIAKALDRKVWLPSGGSLVIDRSEAMTVVDVNTGKFTGSGGNLEATVTKNNLEAAEEIVNQIRLRDVGGIIVIDFIDMVLESNRDLVLRRLVECLGRDRTRHQVAEVTSLGLVQMTRKRVGQGLLDVFSEPCEHCNGRGVRIQYEPVDHDGQGEQHQQTPQPARSGRSDRSEQSGRSGRGRRGSAAPDVETAGRPGPAEVIRAVAKAATNAHRADEAMSAGNQSVDSLPAADPTSQESATSTPPDATSALETVEVFTAAGDDTGNDPNTDAGTGTDGQSDAGSESPAPRARRTRATRRPAGPPRPVGADQPSADGQAPSTQPSTIQASDRQVSNGQPSVQSSSDHPSGDHPSGDQAAEGEAAAPAPRRRRGRASRPAGAPTG